MLDLTSSEIREALAEVEKKLSDGPDLVAKWERVMELRWIMSEIDNPDLAQGPLLRLIATMHRKHERLRQRAWRTVNDLMSSLPQVPVAKHLRAALKEDE